MGTIKAIKSGFYYNSKNKRVDLPNELLKASVKNTVKYSSDKDFDLKYLQKSTDIGTNTGTPKDTNTESESTTGTNIGTTEGSTDGSIEGSPNGANIEVIEGDTLDVAFALCDRGYNPVVLNMASDTNVGGGYLNGAGAQEESLFRRTNLFQCLDGPQKSKFYPIPLTGNIYTKNAVVIAKSETDNYDYLDEPRYISFITAAAYRCNKTDNRDFINHKLPDGKHEFRLNDKLASLMKAKINNIFRTALSNRHDCVILGAFGCGAYGNDANNIARLFKEVIEANKYNEYIKIVFAIIDDGNSFNNNNVGNLIPFQKVFVNV